MKKITFRAFGTPAPKGSTKAFAYLDKIGKPRAAVTHDSKATKPWQVTVHYAAREANVEGWLLEGPVGITLVFYFERPKSHFNTKGQVRPGAPAFPMAVRKSDLDKLVRCVYDALTGSVWRDDSQVVLSSETKQYATPAERPGVRVTVEEIA